MYKDNKPKKRGLKMTCIKLDDVFLTFVNNYVKHKKFRLPTDIFSEIETIRNEYPAFFDPELEKNASSQIYWSESDYSRGGMDVLSEEEIKDLDKNIIVKERVMHSIGEFRRFLLENPIRIFYSKLDGPEHQKLSNKFFANRHAVAEILKHRFSSYEGHSLYVENDDFEKAIKQYFVEERDALSSEEGFVKKDKLAYCMYRLFGKLECKGILDKFPDDSSYGEQGEVANYLQAVYDVSPSLIARNLLPALKTLKK